MIVEVSPLQGQDFVGFNRLGDLDTSACGSNGLGRRRAVADPTKLSPVGCSFVFVVHVFIRNPGPEGRHAIQGHSMYFAVELCILLWNYVFYCGIICMLLRN